MIVEEITRLGKKYTVYDPKTHERILYTYLASTAVKALESLQAAQAVTVSKQKFNT
jgi:hypothetical protein